MPLFQEIIDATIAESISVFFYYWWIFVFVIIWPMFQMLWVTYVQEKTMKKMKWDLLEVKVSPELEKRPKTMEEFFSGIYSTYDVVIDTLYDIYLAGAVDVWFSFEIVSFEGDIHFYINTPEVERAVVESQIYAVYPDAEIKEVKDYVANVPTRFPNEKWEMWGTEMKLQRDSGYPLRTYKEFEDPASGLFVDPVGSIVEGVNKLGPGEQFWIQILVRPTDDSWKKAARALIYKLAGREVKDKSSGGFLEKLQEEVVDLMRHVIFDFFNPDFGVAKKEEKQENPFASMMLHLSPGEVDTIKGIDEKIKKSGFETMIRYIYIADKKIFNKAKANGLYFSYFAQFGTEFQNRLVPVNKTSAYYFATNWRKDIKRNRIMRKFKKREFDVKSYVLVTDELATLFHFPTNEVKGPTVPRVEAKKGKPPATLPI